MNDNDKIKLLSELLTEVYNNSQKITPSKSAASRERDKLKKVLEALLQRKATSEEVIQASGW